MFSEIWSVYLYQPVLNALIWIYNNLADKNMGWAVIYLTVFLRFLLLPLTIVSERNAIKHDEAEAEAKKALVSFKGDVLAQKDAYRKVMNKYHLSPWAKVITLIIQVIVLILLYQVFIRGISGEKMYKTLYHFIDFPGKINTLFYGFEIGRPHDAIWAGLAALYLFFSILVENRKRERWSGSEFTFLIIFPAFTFGILWLLPMVKSLFILTTMLFSDTVSLIRKVIFPAPKEEKE